MTLGETEPTLRTLTGSICPRCRHQVGEPVGARLVRCSDHPNTVMVSPHALAESDGDPFLGAVIEGRFAVLELIGAGSMGTVYRARQEAMGRDVALKIVRADRLLDSQAKTRFQREAHAMSLLESPHTVTVFDFGEITATLDDPAPLQGSLYLAMELLEGESVGERIKRFGRLDQAEALTVLRHALSSLAEAHEKGVIHRDLKPDNLVITTTATGQLRCKVLDFGIAKILTSDGRVDVLETQAGTVFGTPRYMSPEQAQGKKLDARSDIYALGVILYHTLVGRPPFTDDDAILVMAHHIKTAPKRPREVAPDLPLPEPLEALLMRALEKDPARRPPSADEFLQALDAAVASAHIDGTGTMAALAQSPAAAGRSPLFLGAVIAAALVVGGLALVRVAARSGQGSASSAPAVASGPAETSAVATAQPLDAVKSSDEQPVPNAPSGSASSSSSALPAASAAKPALVPIKKRSYTKFDR